MALKMTVAGREEGKVVVYIETTLDILNRFRNVGFEAFVVHAVDGGGGCGCGMVYKYVNSLRCNPYDDTDVYISFIAK